MQRSIDTTEQRGPDARLGTEFTERLEGFLQAADHDRRRHQWWRRVQSLLPLVLLVGPLLAWRLMAASPLGLHVIVDTLAWVTFLLDVGVRLDSAVMSYLGLQALPSIVGVLLLAVVTGWLLQSSTGDDR